MIKKVVVLILLVSYNVTAQTFNKTKLEALFQLIETNNKGMGSISIFENGKEIYQNCIGYADVENNVETDYNTKYRIGSISKTFTAAIIMQLIDEHKLTLQTLLSDYFPRVPNATRITIDNLLRHSSGLHDLTDTSDFNKWMVLPQTREMMLQRIIDSKPIFIPNEKGAYSNTNYLLLSYIAEKIEKSTYSEILERRISKPLKLTNTYYGQKINVNNGEALPYLLEKSKWDVQNARTDMSVPIGAGAIVSTPKDLNMFFHSLFYGKLISAASLKKMKTLKNNFGIGLMQFPFGDIENYGHPGAIDGFQSMTMYLPKEKIGISYLSNGVELPLNGILMGVLKIYLNIDYELPDFKSGLQLKPDELDNYTGVYKGDEFPFEITIVKNDTVLMANIKDGPNFRLDAYKKDIFKSDKAAVQMKFYTNQNEMILDIGNKQSKFIRE